MRSSELLLYISAAFLIGFGVAWILKTIEIQKLKRSENSLNGLLESERLVKETLRKESALAFQLKETIEADFGKKLKEAEHVIKEMDRDILLLQKSNEETEMLFKKLDPEMYDVKIKLLEANNTIARLKGQTTQNVVQ
jgi:tRNA U34 5-carboxymethylaminomethyl modifying GTPase MnmE/TrmE